MFRGERQRDIYVSHIHWVTRGTGTPEGRDEVNRRNNERLKGNGVRGTIIIVSTVL